jgi:hypothetical protein
MRKLCASGAIIALLGLMLTGCAQYWFGSDAYSPQASQAGTQPTFYVGRLGEGVDPSFLFDGGPNACASNSWGGNGFGAGASPLVVDPHRQFGWWWFRGPQASFNDPYNPGSTGVLRAYDLGVAQGVAAIWCWLIQGSGASNGGAIGLNVFADVEICICQNDPTYWWVAPDDQPLTDPEQINENTQVLVGFLDEVGGFTGVSPGVYISKSVEERLFPGINLATGCSVYRCPDPLLPAVWWQTGGCDVAGAVTTTYPNVPPVNQVEQEMANIEANTQGASVVPNGQVVYFPGPCSLLRLAPALWQYVIGSVDLDIADSNQLLQPSQGSPEQRFCRNYGFFIGSVELCGDYFFATPVYVGGT